MADDVKEVADFLQSDTVNQYLDEIAEDSENAIETAKTNLAYGGMKEYPSEIVSAYKKDLDRNDKAHNSFNVEFNRVANNQAKDLKAFEAAYSKHILALEILEQQNVDHSALVQADFALKIVAVAKLLTPFTPIAADFRSAEAKWKKILKELETAKKKVKEAKAQAAINTAIGVVVTIIAPQTLIGRLALVGGATLVSATINEVLGSKGVGPAGATVSGVKGAVKASGKLKGGPAKAAGAIGTVATLIVDVQEIKDAGKLAKSLEKQAAAAKKESDAAFAAFEKQEAALMKAWDEFLKAHAAAVKSLGKHSSRQARREKLLKEFKSWN